MLKYPDLEAAQAMQCRRLARVILNPDVARRLLSMADQLESDAERLRVARAARLISSLPVVDLTSASRGLKPPRRASVRNGARPMSRRVPCQKSSPVLGALGATRVD
jgi:hypothetical protein